MLASDDEGFKRPGGPPGTYDEEGGVGVNDAFLFLEFEVAVIDEEVGGFFEVVGEEVLLFCGWFVGGE